MIDREKMPVGCFSAAAFLLGIPMVFVGRFTGDTDTMIGGIFLAVGAVALPFVAARFR